MPLWLINYKEEPPKPNPHPIAEEKTGLPKTLVYPKPLDWLQALYWVQRKL